MMAGLYVACGTPAPTVAMTAKISRGRQPVLRGGLWHRLADGAGRTSRGSECHSVWRSHPAGFLRTFRQADRAWMVLLRSRHLGGGLPLPGQWFSAFRVRRAV